MIFTDLRICLFMDWYANRFSKENVLQDAEILCCEIAHEKKNKDSIVEKIRENNRWFNLLSFIKKKK